MREQTQTNSVYFDKMETKIPARRFEFCVIGYHSTSLAFLLKLCCLFNMFIFRFNGSVTYIQALLTLGS